MQILTKHDLFLVNLPKLSGHVRMFIIRGNVYKLTEIHLKNVNLGHTVN